MGGGGVGGIVFIMSKSLVWYFGNTPGGSVDLGIALHQALNNVHLPARIRITLMMVMGARISKMHNVHTLSKVQCW